MASAVDMGEAQPIPVNGEPIDMDEKPPVPLVNNPVNDLVGDVSSTTPRRSSRAQDMKIKAEAKTTPSPKNPAPRKSNTTTITPKDRRKSQKVKREVKKEESEDKDQGEKFDSHALTYTVPLRQKNFLNCCILCEDTSVAPKKPKAKVKKDELDDNDGEEKKMDESAEEVTMEEESEKDEYVTCAMRNCTQRMHKTCAEEFLCSEYSPRQAQLLFNVEGPVCPSHFCWHCYEERGKNTSRFGELIDCEKCIRSFHLECLPAGCKIASTSGKRKTFVCHDHGPPSKKITPNMRLKYCTECEELFDGDKELKKDPRWDTHPNRKMECKSCTNVYHRKCAFRKVKGANSESYDYDSCPYCLIGLVIVANQYVLAYYPVKCFGLNIGYYPAIALATTDVPEGIARQLGSNFGKPGYIPVKWLWNDLPTTYYNLIPKSQVQRMTMNCKKNIAEKDWKEELKKAAVNFKAPIRPMDHEAMRRTIKSTPENVYSKECPRVLDRQEIYECTCKPDANKIKCNTSDCHNRAINAECSKLCDAAEGVTCANREMQGDAKERPTSMYNVKVTTNGKGWGVFATRKIKPLEFLFEYAGDVINKEELERREKRTFKLRANDEWTYIMGLTSTSLVDARFKGSDARFVNHSCDPNCEVNTIDVPVKYINNAFALYEPKLKVQAQREIKQGEEITFNYGLTKSRGLAIDVCLCGAANCIGKIGKKKKEDDSDDERFDERNDFDDDEESDDSDSEDTDDEKENKKRKKRKRKALKKKKVVEKKMKKEEPKVMATNKRRASLGGPSGSRDRVQPKRNKLREE